MDSPLSEGTKPRQEKPTAVQIDPKWCAKSLVIVVVVIADMTPQPTSLHSALKEFIEPLRTNDSRTDFFSVYRRESEESDRDYARKYDEDLNTSLIFVSRCLSVLRTDH